jgi:hypothetical protein
MRAQPDSIRIYLADRGSGVTTIATDAIAMLIVAAGSDDAGLHVAVQTAGPARVAEILIQELVDRADLHELAPPRSMEVQFVLAAESGPVHRVVRLDAGEVGHEPGLAASPVATVSQDLTDLVRGVYGPSVVRRNVSRSIKWAERRPSDRLAAYRERAEIPAVLQRLLRGAQDQLMDLSGLAVLFGSDKWSRFNQHTAHYEPHLRPLRDRPLKILEIGIGGYRDPQHGGASLRMWKRYFHRSLVYGLDIVDKSSIAEQRIDVVQGDQADQQFLANLSERSGPFDVIIDDGSHYCADVIASFTALFPRLRMGGIYVVEDTATSYWPDYGGSTDNKSDVSTTMGFFKSLVDGLNYEEFEPPEAHRPADTDEQIVCLHFYHNLVIIEKAVNRSGSLPSSRRTPAYPRT